LASFSAVLFLRYREEIKSKEVELGIIFEMKWSQVDVLILYYCRQILTFSESDQVKLEEIVGEMMNERNMTTLDELDASVIDRTKRTEEDYVKLFEKSHWARDDGVGVQGLEKILPNATFRNILLVTLALGTKFSTAEAEKNKEREQLENLLQSPDVPTEAKNKLVEKYPDVEGLQISYDGHSLKCEDLMNFFRK
jgi:hypothetical protein